MNNNKKNGMKSFCNKFLKQYIFVEEEKHVISETIYNIISDLQDYIADFEQNSFNYALVSEAMDSFLSSDDIVYKIEYNINHLDLGASISFYKDEGFVDEDSDCEFWLPYKYLYISREEMKKDFIKNYKTYFRGMVE